MNPRFHAPLRVAAVGAASAVVGVLAAMPASAAGDGSTPGVHVVNTETVQVYTSPSGEIQTRRVYEQLALTGRGSVTLRNPVSTANLRNLDGFSGFQVEHGDQITRTTVDGDKQLRSVSDYNGKLPLDVSVAYKLNGRNVKPGDVVGRDGHLEVTYTVQNVTAEPQELTFDDGQGGTVTKTVQVPIPMVGSLTTTAPSSFTNVQSTSANMGGDGKGGTQLSFTMTLFPPIGSDTAVFGYSADIRDGVVPRAEVSALPVNPMESPTFKSAAGSYKGGADTGAKLADGAGQIDSNLLKLRDGAAQLLGGLIKLRDGAGQLETGLAGQAVPGSEKLAAGAHRLDTGLGRLNAGSKRLAAGTGEALAGADRLSAGTAKASSGGRKLAAGSRKLSVGARKAADGATTIDGYMKQISAGSGDLLDGIKLLEAGVQSLPSSVKAQLSTDPQYLALLGGMQQVVDGIGNPTDVTNPATGQPATVFGGLNAIRYGLRTSGGYATNDCDVKLAGGTPKACGAMDGVQRVSSLLGDAATTSLPALITNAQNAYDSIAGCPPRTGALPPLTALGMPACADAAKVLIGLAAPKGSTALGLPLGGVQSQSQIASDSLKDVYQQVDQGILNLALPRLRAAMVNPDADADCAVGASTPADPTDDCGIQQAVAFFEAKIPVLVDGITTSVSTSLLAGISAPAGGCLPTSKTLVCGATALANGSGALADGTSDLANGAQDLEDGASLLSEKTGELASGLGRIDRGAGRLAGGLGRLDAGANKLAAGAGVAKGGSGQLADGADQLSSGLKGAADGSGRLADGLRTAAGGAPKLVKGAQRLSDEGTKQLVKAGEDTAQNYGELYATMTAGAARADSESMAFGAPEGAVGLTAYNYVIEGDDGEGGRNWARGVGGLAILGAGGAVFAFRRRLV